MARTMLESLICDKSGTNGKRVFRKDIETKNLEKMVEFLRHSYYWPYLLNLARTLEQCADLSQLWFREFYLEITMGKRIQVSV